MLSVRVTDLEQFRIWRDDEDMEVGWLLNRLLRKEAPTSLMKAGTAFHSAIEGAGRGVLATLSLGDYRFDFNCECELPEPAVKELEVQKQYGDLLVIGHVDGLIGKEVIDYKTTGQFDPARYLEGYQWRFYLDLLDANTFRWEVFVMSEFGAAMAVGERNLECFTIREVHRLVQFRYPNLHEDCLRLARDYYDFASGHKELF